MQRRNIRLILWMIFAVWTALVLYGSLSKGENLPTIGWISMIPYFDKLVHFIFYFGEVTLLLLLFDISVRGRILIVLGVIMFSELIELVQPYMGRSSDHIDLLANFLGAIFGMLAASLLNHFVLRKIITE